MATKDYSITQIGLHWWVALLFGANYLVSDGMGRELHNHLDGVDTGTSWVANFHVYVGLGFILFAALRLLFRLIQGAPEALPSKDSRLDRLAVYTHRALYLLMLLVPIAGVLAWYGKIALFGDIHVLLMNLMLALIGLHVVGAIYHRVVLKDEVLARMSFFRRS